MFSGKLNIRKSLQVTIPIAIILAGIWIFIELSEELLENELAGFDNSIINVVQAPISPGLTTVATWVTHGADVITISVISIITIIILSLKRQFDLAVFVAVVNALGGAFNWLLKNAFTRERPTLEVLIEQGGYSYPSGHAMGAMILYGSLAAVLIIVLNNPAKGLIIVSTAVIVLLVGTSRVYLGVHFPSDVLAGFAAGASWLFVCISLLFLYKLRKKKQRSD
ncbi:phosphatase PAP2 family protein [Jeotgalibacillus sp. R-1-5s-1]|uniref:phosphatase PAP2 family protein n=1 Tax=Jeotgalibacillus sp. R-1-5s-1 TaxID=2555897 RepID=UPI001068D778|nr:phosphatase PAP2 family protein [Jeotgalibacillus sp. R-1-5s-1]TFE03353.1 phosphatase PAP2 family protein [Jeotgalibacillus sp. R-1-5s-1]